MANQIKKSGGLFVYKIMSHSLVHYGIKKLWTWQLRLNSEDLFFKNGTNLQLNLKQQLQFSFDVQAEKREILNKNHRNEC